MLVEVLNADCPHCMEQVPAMNRLYHLIKASELNGRIKFIGVVSNSESRGAWWKSAYKVPLSLIPDPEWVIGNDILKITGTPTTVVLDKQGKVIILHDRVFADANKAFQGLHAKIK